MGELAGVAAGAEGVEIRPARPGDLIGIVVDRQSGEPLLAPGQKIEGVQLSLRPQR